MGKRIGGVLNGTGAALYVCIGFVPDFVKVWNLEDADEAVHEWNRSMMRAADLALGIAYVGSSDATQQAATAYNSTGIAPYYGGDVMTSDNQTSLSIGEGVYVVKNDKDYRYPSADGGDAVALTIDSWTLGSSSNKTGNFNEDVVGTYIQEGSPIYINGRRYAIMALTAGQGEAANEVTLNQAAASGPVNYIGAFCDYIPLALGKIAPAGFCLQTTSVTNVNDELIGFEAGTYDD